MASYIERGDSLFIPFRNGVSISDSQCRPRMYKSIQNFEKSFPTHNLGNKNIELVEYAEVKHGSWIFFGTVGFTKSVYQCSQCGRYEEMNVDNKELYCHCGAKMDTQ